MRNYTVKITDKAEHQIQFTIQYYNTIRPGLGRKFYEAYLDRLQVIKQNPLTHSIRYGEIRLSTFKKFLYSIHYRFKDNVILILAIYSDYQNS